ncbi:hypothetical protein CesoFtcFv8_022745 [Champsocephalus esox]|uniref:Uncharacterized protein n=1 Tax=Champsocephalus esox TaxID=159716 RepID=A0AAN8B7F4_9TELE|nr:hypothetical protein CesoFtcFv8_022745 [Champsocephalus esox]
MLSSCCSAHLLLSDLKGRSVDAKLLQREDDLASRAHRNRTVQQNVQMVDAGILGAEEERAPCQEVVMSSGGAVT